MEAPLTDYQRTHLIQAMTAVTANNNNQDGPMEEMEDLTDDEDEGGVTLSRDELEDRGLIHASDALFEMEW